MFKKRPNNQTTPPTQAKEIPSPSGQKRKPKRLGSRTLKTVPGEVLLALYERIRKGAYVHIAAEACGIPLRSLNRWMQRGAHDYDRGRDTRFSQLYANIIQAQAQARVSAEHRVWTEDPKWWLKNGPGKADWTATLHLHSELETREEVEHHHTHTVTHEYTIEGIPDDIAATRIAEAMKCLEDLGLLQRTDEGRKVFTIETNNNAAQDDEQPPEP